MNLSRRTQIIGLAAWLALSAVVAAVGGLASLDADAFYTQLVRPAWAPPPALFGPVWTGLYVLMGLAAWMVWRVNGFGGARVALLEAGPMWDAARDGAMFKWSYASPRRGAGSRPFSTMASMRRSSSALAAGW